MRASFRCFVIASLALMPATAAAQVTSGIVLERGDPAHRVGVQLGGALGVGLTSRLALQFEGAYLAFGKTPDQTYYTPCLPPSAGAPPCGPVRVTGTRLSLWSSNDVTRFGWNVGGGVQVSRFFSLDIRYHQLIESTSTRSLVPVTFSLRF